MTEKMIIVFFLALAVPMFAWMAETKFSYVHPNNASKAEVARFPRRFSIIITHHNLLKWGGAGLYWLGGSGLILMEPSLTYVGIAMYGVCFVGGLSFVLTLVWRLYVLAK